MKIMKKLMKLALCAVVVTTLGACKEKNDAELARLQAQIDSLEQISSQKDSSLSDIDAFVNQLSAGLDTIAMQEKLLVAGSREGGRATREQMLKNIQLFAKTLKDQRAKINQLTEDMKTKGVKMEKLQGLVNFMNQQLDEKDRMITDLRTELSQKDVDIAELTDRITGLSNDNVQLEEAVSQQGQQLAQQDAQLNTGFVVIGSGKTLKDRGVTTGGFLKKTTVNYNTLPQNVFTKIDIRSFNELPIPAGKVKVLSAMPASSYQIIRVDNNNSRLRILDRDAFWRNSRYLVVQTD